MRSIWKITGYFYTLFRAIPGINIIYHNEKKALSSLLEKLSYDGQISHLDLGSGNGSTYDIFPAQHDITAIDHSASMLASLKKQYPGVRTISGDLFTSIPNEKYELISLIGVSEYVSDLPALLKLAKEHLTGEATLLITSATPNLWNQLRRLHGHRLWLRNRKRVAALLKKAGFVILAERKTLLQIQILARLDN